MTFARDWDPQPVHLDQAATVAAIDGGLIASGWLSVGVCMRLYAAGAAGGAPARRHAGARRPSTSTARRS